VKKSDQPRLTTDQFLRTTTDRKKLKTKSALPTVKRATATDTKHRPVMGPQCFSPYHPVHGFTTGASGSESIWDSPRVFVGHGIQRHWPPNWKKSVIRGQVCPRVNIRKVLPRERNERVLGMRRQPPLHGRKISSLIISARYGRPRWFSQCLLVLVA
jgi:hypothetical protein